MNLCLYVTNKIIRLLLDIYEGGKNMSKTNKCFEPKILLASTLFNILKIRESSNVRRVSQTNLKDNCEVHASKISRNKIRTWH